MFLTNLIRIWKGESLLTEMLKQFDDMIEKADWMCDVSRKTFRAEIEADSVADEFYATDKEINDMEKSIRKKVFELLIVNPQADVPACLVLMSVVKDVERVGDYAKNIFELVTQYGRHIKDGDTLEKVIEIQDRIEVITSRTRKAFRRSDSHLAQDAVETARKVLRRCDECVKEMFDSSYPVREAVMFALAFRYMKRIAAHLANICTTILKPLPEIDYFDGL